jgi:tRNA dimethylallyltransferase
MQEKKNKIIVIVGPTASGKSDLAIKLAQKFNGEIISADSRQVYRGMDIGTGKVTKREQKLVPHHLLDVASPKKIFTVDDYQRLGRKAMATIFKKEKTPIIVGGTGLYLDALVYEMKLPHVSPHKNLRAKLEKQSTEQLFNQLQKLDPVRAAHIDRHNPRRLVRALEIVITTGKPVPRLTKQSPYTILWLGIMLPKEKLEKRIATRLTARLKQGMVAEVKRIHAQGVSWKRLETFGLEYRAIAEHLQGKVGLPEIKISLERAIIQYAKRQMTWFKRNQDIHWIANQNEARRLVRIFLS